jgi:hypothetical protein
MKERKHLSIKLDEEELKNQKIAAQLKFLLHPIKPANNRSPLMS